MSTETNAPARRVRHKTDEASTDAIPSHPPLTPHGLRDEALKAWFMDHYPVLAAFLYTGKIINPEQP